MNDSDPEPSQPRERPLAPGLYLVATPIGNLEDITLRALRVLRSVDRIACEDTRQTAKLLHHYGITTPTVSYHQHNENARSAELLEALRAGGRIAVVRRWGSTGKAMPEFPASLIPEPPSWLRPLQRVYKSFQYPEQTPPSAH